MEQSDILSISLVDTIEKHGLDMFSDTPKTREDFDSEIVQHLHALMHMFTQDIEACFIVSEESTLIAKVYHKRSKPALYQCTAGLQKNIRLDGWHITIRNVALTGAFKDDQGPSDVLERLHRIFKFNQQLKKA